MQTAISFLQMRGGTSKGLYFLADDLPEDAETRDAVLLAAMGSPDARQIDGLGGAASLTSKVAILSAPTRDDADIDYLFAQVVVEQARVDYGQNCGNILAGVGPFAIEQGLVRPAGDETPVRVHMVNSGQLATITVPTPKGQVEYTGTTRISGVPGTASALVIEFQDTAGANCGALLPTGNPRDQMSGIEVTCIDNGMPVVVIKAEDLGIKGNETPEALEANTKLKELLEAIRREAGPMMALGDVTERTVPKLAIISPPCEGGTLTSRMFIPHRCHQAIGVLGAVSVASVCLVDGSITEGWVNVPEGARKHLSIEHPTGEFTVALTVNAQGNVERSGVVRTARLLARGDVMIPEAVYATSPVS